MVQSEPGRRIREVRFYKSGRGREPVREWLGSLSAEQKKVIGRDIKTLQLGWPIGMPLARKMGPRIWEVRSRLDMGFARVLFTVNQETIVLLHGFIKKSMKTPTRELNTAKKRMRRL
mgnify:CR=1 FL=1